MLSSSVITIVIVWLIADEGQSKIIYKPRILTIDHSVYMLWFLRQINSLSFPR